MEITNSEKNNPEKSSDSQKEVNNIGALIKKAREQKNITVESLSEDLKINRSYLFAIESGDYKSLPEIIYVKAMIRRIAEKLQLDIDVQSLFKEGAKSREELPIKSKEIKKVQSNKSFLLISLFAIAAVFLGAFTVKFGLQLFLMERDSTEIISPNSKK